MKLTGKRAIVTGGGRDIGAAVAKTLAREGASVAISYFESSAGADVVVADIKNAGDNALAVQADLNTQAGVDALVGAAVAEFGGVDILVNNAGGLVARKTIAEMDLAHWQQVMDLNLTSTFMMTKACLGHMTKGKIVNIASQQGSWLLADEVYRGAERCGDDITPSFFGRYDKVIAIGSMSKAYGLPGLRVGWAAAPPSLLDEMWARHEYVAISATMISNKLAAIALEPETRLRLLSRTRDYIRAGFPVLEKWMGNQQGLFSLTPPDASAVAFIRYHLEYNSSKLIDRLLNEKSVLIVPGDHFGLDNFVRISFGLPHDYLTSALDRIASLIEELQCQPS